MSQFKYTTKTILCIAILLLAQLAFVNVQAEESKAKQNEPKKDVQVTSEKKNKTIKPNIGKRSRVTTLEEFIPSEEVSADKPVAFPSDI